MKHWYLYSFCVFVFWSCEFLPSPKTTTDTPIAKVHTTILYKSELEEALPDNLSKLDSAKFVSNYINTWATQQLLLHQAEINLTDKSVSFEKLVSDYRNTLYINSYKEALVLEKVDTLITKEQLEGFYEENKANFRLNEELVQFKYLQTNLNRADERDLIKQFRSQKEEDLTELEDKSLEFVSYHFNDSVWVQYSQLNERIPVLRDMPKNELLKKSKFIKKEDSIGLYLISVKNVLKRNEIAPLSYVSPTIKQIILQKRKFQLLQDIEVDLLNDAIKNQYFERY
ncbi:hypothetical protein KH5_16720 [Urechidicola sp. KH5]